MTATLYSMMQIVMCKLAIFFKRLHYICTVYNRGSQLISMVSHKGPKTAQRYMSQGQMNTITLYFSKLTKGQPRMVGGVDFAHGPSVENPFCIIRMINTNTIKNYSYKKWFFNQYHPVVRTSLMHAGFESETQRCDFSGNFLISGNFGNSALYKRIGKHFFFRKFQSISGNFDHAESHLWKPCICWLEACF